ncbi:cucurbitadienol 11-hydroxylase isoform X1 [Hevea brasiliensis]|uniref:cucurbitadienol 11-hydroxylase isoform X1 n=1 Tax=Hevea brasiliensis TaxID=3981 RepID=UPI0025DD1C4F|nr:cucurbitadienol 11-hydroxylase isoform X1 [Hevea brasiliensis]
MLTVVLLLVGFFIIYYTYWISKWRNPNCNGVLPPGSMGFPLIGETLQLLIPSYSLDLHPFIKKRIHRYGPIFRSNLAGRPVIVSADPEFNYYILSQEGRSVEIWYLDTFSKLFRQQGESRTNVAGYVHKYLRGAFLSQIGSENLREKLLLHIQDMVNRTLCSWSNQESVEVKHSASLAVCDFTAKVLFGYDAEKSPDNLSETFTRFVEGLISFPLNIPRTAYRQCLQDRQKALSILKNVLTDRRNSVENYRGDVLDLLLNDMGKEKFLTEDFICLIMLGGLFASFESISTITTLLLKLFSAHPEVVQELEVRTEQNAEHEKILVSRHGSDSLSITWDEYKSMTFTHQVINETLRLGNVAPGLLRRAIKDVQFKGYTIPSGWTIMMVTSAQQVNPEVYKDPLVFNPWRWKDFDSITVSKNFTPFGGGTRQCVGAEYSRLTLSLFIHLLVTKYRWTKIKEGEIRRAPMLGFGDGIHFKFSEKE